MSFDDYDDRIIDLSWVKSANEAPENQKYLCPIRGPFDSELHEVTDLKQLEFVAAGDKRYVCLQCGWLMDSSDPRIRRQERVQTVVSLQNGRPNPPIFETVKPANKDKLRSSDHVNEFSFNLHPGDLEQLRHEGMQLKSEEVRSSVSGKSYITKPKPKCKEGRKN